eukprot:TRINITY_DN57416_c0_g1_i1.p1 TRINITY_DN57416_c0_g1~~TRINITY_DN57416_c0_g1_i1.p1  ORF type:complete len:157 (-),score=41.25 TRINITY_DN57416_c0_g1_i1:175-645(-)
MQLVVKVLTGIELYLDVEASDTVGLVKTRISDRLGVPVADQKLLTCGKRMEDCAVLAEYNLQEGSVLYLVHRVRTAVQAYGWPMTRQLEEARVVELPLSPKEARLAQLSLSPKDVLTLAEDSEDVSTEAEEDEAFDIELELPESRLAEACHAASVC